MDDLLQSARIAFRRQHGLVSAPASERRDPPTPDAAFLRKVSRHRLVGLFAAEWFPEWKTRAYGQMQYTATCTAAAETIHARLRDAIPAVGLIKGPALAVQAWPQPGLRQYDDLDFRCAFVPYGRLREAFSTLGYEPVIPREARNAHLWHFGWGVAFDRPGGPLVECNHRMFPPFFPWPSRVRRAVRSCWRMQTLDQVPVNIPGPELHLLIGCMHALWHGWDRIAWLVDIAGLLVRHPESLDRARTLAGRGGFSRRALEAGCGLAASLLGPLPGVRTVDPGSPSGWQALFGDDPRSRVEAARREHLRCMDGPERLRYTIGRAFTPGDPDFRWWCLPAGLRPAYWLLRPVRIALRTSGC